MNMSHGAQTIQLHNKICNSSASSLKLPGRRELKHISMDLMFNITLLLNKVVPMRGLFS